jgi:hypothetical protein
LLVWDSCSVDSPVVVSVVPVVVVPVVVVVVPVVVVDVAVVVAPPLPAGVASGTPPGVTLLPFDITVGCSPSPGVFDVDVEVDDAVGVGVEVEDFSGASSILAAG